MKPTIVEKLWGREEWIHNDSDYCGKVLVFYRAGNHCSMHYHMKKKETWYVSKGSFLHRRFAIGAENGGIVEAEIRLGDLVNIRPGLPHQLVALEDDSRIFEVSTEHFDDDSYRLFRDVCVLQGPK